MNVENKFKHIDDMFTKIMNKNRRDLENAAIKPIHDKFLLAQNGIV